MSQMPNRTAFGLAYATGLSLMTMSEATPHRVSAWLHPTLVLDRTVPRADPQTSALPTPQPDAPPADPGIAYRDPDGNFMLNAGGC